MQNIQLSKDFSLLEMIQSNTADRLGIKEQYEPSQKIIDNLTVLVLNVLQPLRDVIGSPIRVNSGYRCPALNMAIGGSKTSDHMQGAAADIALLVDVGTNNKLLYDKVIELDIPFKQLIWEFGTDLEPAWIHISYFMDIANKMSFNRREKLKALKQGQRTIYQKMI